MGNYFYYLCIGIACFARFNYFSGSDVALVFDQRARQFYGYSCFGILTGAAAIGFNLGAV